MSAFRGFGVLGGLRTPEPIGNKGNPLERQPRRFKVEKIPEPHGEIPKNNESETGPALDDIGLRSECF